MWVRIRWLAAAALATWPGAALAEGDAGATARASAAGGAGGRSTVVAESACPSGERKREEGAVRASVADEDLARWNVGGSSDPACGSNRPGFHVAPRVVVDVSLRPRQLPVRSSRKGVLSETAVLAQARNHGYWAFRLCFEQGLRNAPKLRGKTRVHAVLDAAGGVRQSRVTSTELADREVATCLAAHAEQLRFSPAPPRRLGLDLVVDLSPGDAPLPELHLSDVDPAASTMDTRRVSDLLGAALGPAGACYAKALSSDPALWGRIGLRVDVDRHGNVTVREHESRFPDPGVVRCVTDAVGALPIASAMTAPGSFTWGLRLGSPQRGQALGSAPGAAEITLSTAVTHTKVADSPDTRLPLAR
jgi:hypothetical protein